jgi:hypothetical protein
MLYIKIYTWSWRIVKRLAARLAERLSYCRVGRSDWPARSAGDGLLEKYPV